MDVLDVVAHSKDGLPSRHRVGAHDGVNSLEHITDVFWSPTCRREELEVVLLSCCVEVWLGVVCRESVEEAPERGRDAIIELVP